jgi:hypothetical protein
LITDCSIPEGVSRPSEEGIDHSNYNQVDS